MGTIYNSRTVTANLILGLDFLNPKSYNTANANNLAPIITSPYSNVFLSGVNEQRFTVENGYVTFNRAANANSQVEKSSAGGFFATNPLAFPKLQYNTFYYKDHTFEIWVKVNTFDPAYWDGSEQQQWIAGHKGYNQGWGILTNSIYYSIWDTSALARGVTFLNKDSEINPNVWYQLVLTRQGTTWLTYQNGIVVDSNTIYNPAPNNGVSNSAALVIGAQGQSANFAYYSKCSIASIRMYDRALSNVEILQNFNALRGRFGI